MTKFRSLTTRLGWSRLLLPSLVMAGLAGCGPSAAVRRAQSLYDSGDYAAAAAAADTSLASDRGDDDLWRLRIRAALAQADAAGVAAQYAAYRTARSGADDHELLTDMATATLEQGLSSPSTKAKLEAIRTVEDLMLMDFADRVATLMGDADDVISAAAAVAVMRGYPGAAYAATDGLTSDNPQARRIATAGIGDKVGELAGADLRKMVRDPDASVRAAAIVAIAPFTDAASRGLVAKALKDPDAAVRAAAAEALARRNGGATMEQAQAVLADRAPSVRLAGIAMLASLRATDSLRSLLADADASFALRAAAALKAPKDSAVMAAYDRALADPSPAVRSAAVNAWSAAFGCPAAAAIARNHLADPAAPVRRAAARALAYNEPSAAPEAREVLAALVTDPSLGTLSLTAAAELAALGDIRGEQALSLSMTSPDPSTRMLAATLHQTVARRVTPGLLAALADVDPEVRVVAAHALLKLAR